MSRTAVVTGSSSGIGRAIALRFARDGARVIVHANRSLAAAERVHADIVSAGGQAEVLLADLTDPAAREAFVERAHATLGDVDVWVNNAGADVLTGEAPNLSFEEKLERLWALDVRATLLISRDVGERMCRRGEGSIVNLGWDQAATGMEGDSGELFAATKGAVMAFTRSLALSLAPRVRVNCIAPGWIRTAWGETAPRDWNERVLRETPLDRWGTPEDVAGLAAYLASDDACYVTGQILNCNGGAIR